MKTIDDVVLMVVCRNAASNSVSSAGEEVHGRSHHQPDILYIHTPPRSRRNPYMRFDGRKNFDACAHSMVDWQLHNIR